jgi:hypothetical protein
MGGRDVGRRLLVGLASLALLAGCGAGASPTPLPASPTPISVPSAAVATPTPTPAPTPVTYGPVTLVTGASTCPGLDFAWTFDADGTKHVRDDYHADRCTLTTDDPRVSGSRSSTWNMDLWGRLGISHQLVQWGTQRLENDSGAWEGRATGVAAFPSSPGDIIAHWYRGTGGYAGLSYFELWTGFDPWKIQGQIFPGDPPPPYAEEAMGTGRPVDGGPVAEGALAWVTGTATCPTADLGSSTTDENGVIHYRGGTFGCDMRTDDPRVSGTHTSDWNADWWGEPDMNKGALVQWSTPRLENAGGAWEGTLSGVFSTDRGDIIAVWYKGTGGYAGLSYFELWTGFQPWTIQGQIFPGDPPTP